MDNKWEKLVIEFGAPPKKSFNPKMTPALCSPVPEAKYLANPSETALKVEPVSTVSVLVSSQLTGVSIIPAFGGLVWYDAGSD